MKIVEKLQTLLTDLSDSTLLLKHAHWNVRGALLLSLHEQLNTTTDTFRDAEDEIAERIVTRGHPSDGLVQLVAEGTGLNPLRAS